MDFEYTTVLNLPVFWIYQGCEYARVLNMLLVLEISKFWIYHGSKYARVTHGSDYAWICLMMLSRENDQKLNLGNFLTISRSNISKFQILLINGFHSTWRSYLVPTSGQKPKKSFETYQSVWFWANLETFSRISPNQEFSSKIRLCHFSTFIVP